MKNLLVPTDFSAAAHNAFEVALQLARRTGGRITLLHVLDVPAGSGFVSSGGRSSAGSMAQIFTLKLLQNTKHHMHELMREALSRVQDVELHEVVSTEEFDVAVLAAIREHNIDLVVMGAHDENTERSWWASSKTEHIVRLAPCPVLTVKHPQPDFDVHQLVFASDFSDEADRAVPGLRELQQLFPEATLHLLDVVPGPGQPHEVALEKIHAFASRHRLTDYEPDVFDAARPSAGIPRFAQQAHADLVVMLTHGHTGLSHLFHANTAEDVALHAHAPVLTMHA